MVYGQELDEDYSRLVEETKGKKLTDAHFREYLKFGQSFERENSFFKALQTYFSCLERVEKEKKPDLLKVAKLKKRIGGNYFHVSNLEKAQTYWEESYEIYLDQNEEKEISDLLNNLAVIFYRKQEYENAKKYFKRSSRIKTKLGQDEELLVPIYLNLSSIFIAEEAYDSSFYYCNKANEIAEAYNVNHLKGICASGIGIHYLAMDEVKLAKRFLLKSMEYSDELPSIQTELEVLRSLAECYDELNQIDSANSIRREIVSLQYDLAVKQSSKIGSVDEFAYWQKQKEAELKIVNAEKENERLKKRMLLLLIIALVVLVLAVFFSIFQRFKRISASKKLDELRISTMEVEQQKMTAELESKNKEALLQQQQIDHKNRELSMATLHMVAKNDMLSEIRQFLSIKLPDNTSILKKIDSFISSDSDWEQFKIQFENVHTNFFKVLTSSYPEITSEEIRLCAYLRMNLDSKEIAQILFISPDAVNKRRARLRKKMKLNREDNLNQLLINLS